VYTSYSIVVVFEISGDSLDKVKHLLLCIKYFSVEVDVVVRQCSCDSCSCLARAGRPCAYKGGGKYHVSPFSTPGSCQFECCHAMTSVVAVAAATTLQPMTSFLPPPLPQRDDDATVGEAIMDCSSLPSVGVSTSP